MTTITLPGLIDPHVHLRDPGQTDKEDFYTGTAAALAGGYTTIIDMPNNPTPITTLETLNEKINIAREKVVCDIGFHFGSLGDNFEEFDKVKGKVMGLKLYLNKTTGNFLLDQHHLGAIFKVWPANLPILVHALDDTFDEVLEVLKKHPRKIHLCHLSTEYELKRIIEAKELSLPVTCGTTPHHLFLNETDMDHLGPFGTMKPPLRKKSDVEFLWKHLKAIDLIESDHAPHTIEEKKQEPAPFGVPGLETTLPLLLTAISENRLTIDDVIRLCHTGPARCFHVSTHQNTNIEVDTTAEYEIKNENLFTKSKWSPFNGWKVRGKIRRVTLRGKEVFQDGQVIASPGSGNILTPAH